jgi:hypothetical protein
MPRPHRITIITSAILSCMLLTAAFASPVKADSTYVFVGDPFNLYLGAAWPAGL